MGGTLRTQNFKHQITPQNGYHNHICETDNMFFSKLTPKNTIKPFAGHLNCLLRLKNHNFKILQRWPAAGDSGNLFSLQTNTFHSFKILMESKNHDFFGIRTRD
jgi:hypothetical protein